MSEHNRPETITKHIGRRPMIIALLFEPRPRPRPRIRTLVRMIVSALARRLLQLDSMVF